MTEEEKNAARALSEAIGEHLEANLPTSMGFPDWVYRDLPRMTVEVMEGFIELVGTDNIKILTFASYQGHDDVPDTCRGQCLLSPEAMVRIEAAALKAPTED